MQQEIDHSRRIVLEKPRKWHRQLRADAGQDIECGE
jgi:hypothetical protein